MLIQADLESDKYSDVDFEYEAPPSPTEKESAAASESEVSFEAKDTEIAEQLEKLRDERDEEIRSRRTETMSSDGERELELKSIDPNQKNYIQKQEEI